MTCELKPWKGRAHKIGAISCVLLLILLFIFIALVYKCGNDTFLFLTNPNHTTLSTQLNPLINGTSKMPEFGIIFVRVTQFESLVGLWLFTGLFGKWTFAQFRASAILCVATYGRTPLAKLDIDGSQKANISRINLFIATQNRFLIMEVIFVGMCVFKYFTAGEDMTDAQKIAMGNFVLCGILFGFAIAVIRMFCLGVVKKYKKLLLKEIHFN